MLVGIVTCDGPSVVHPDDSEWWFVACTHDAVLGVEVVTEVHCCVAVDGNCCAAGLSVCD